MPNITSNSLRSIICSSLVDCKSDDAFAYYCAYRCVLPNRSELSRSNIVMNLYGAIAIITYGKVIRVTSNENRCKIDYNQDGRAFYSAPSGSLGMSERDARLILILPGDPQNPSRNCVSDFESKRRYFAALVLATMGINIVFNLEFEHIFYPNSSKFTVTFPAGIVRPELFRPPSCSASDVSVVQTLHDAIRSKSKELVRRFELALDWFERGVRAEGDDALIYLWIAFEALLLENSSNINPIKDSIAQAYGITRDRANDKFGIGRILNMRSNLVHGNRIDTISSQLKLYIEALFTDALYEQAGLSNERRAEAKLEGRDFDPTDFKSPSNGNGSEHS